MESVKQTFPLDDVQREVLSTARQKIEADISQGGTHLGDHFRYARRAIGINQVEMAAVLGIHRTTVSKIECNTHPVSHSLIHALLKLLDRAIEGEDIQQFSWGRLLVMSLED